MKRIALMFFPLIFISCSLAVNGSSDGDETQTVQKLPAMFDYGLESYTYQHYDQWIGEWLDPEVDNYSYNDFGLVSKLEEQHWSFLYSYDTTGKLIQNTYVDPSGNSIEVFTYDDSGHLSAMTSYYVGTGTTLDVPDFKYEYEWDASGYGISSIERFNYNKTTETWMLVSRIEYGYGASGELLQEKNYSPNNTAMFLSKEYSYVYDTVNQTIEMNYISYNSSGVITYQGSEKTFYETGNAIDRIEYYDANGDLSQKELYVFENDRLKEIQIYTFLEEGGELTWTGKLGFSWTDNGSSLFWENDTEPFELFAASNYGYVVW